MKNPDFTLTLVRFLLVASTVTAPSVLLADPPESGGAKGAARSKPQVIYHLPPASNYGATLHSQAKGQNNTLPIDSDMPASLQTSRANANAAAAQEHQTPAPTPYFQERSPQPKLKSNRSPGRSRSFSKPSSRWNPHGNKSHKK